MPGAIFGKMIEVIVPEDSAMQPRDYGPFPYGPIKDRPKLDWPDGARLAVWVIPNIEFFPLTRGIPPNPGAPAGKPPSVRAWAQRDYGNRVGIWRIMDVLEKHGVRASPTLNSDICEHHPQIVRAAVELGWEILGHNQTNSVWLDALSPDEERETIRLTLSRIAELSGRKPLGWLGSGLAETWHTLDFLADEGCLYVADWVNDDQPYMMDIGGKPLVSIPYSYEINDAPFIGYRNGTVDEFELAIRRQFDTLYAEGAQSGRVMAICLHPYLIGDFPIASPGLDPGAPGYIRAHDGDVVRHRRGDRAPLAGVGRDVLERGKRRTPPTPGAACCRAYRAGVNAAATEPACRIASTPSVPVIKTVVLLALRWPPDPTAMATADMLWLFGTSATITTSYSPNEYQPPISLPPAASHAGRAAVSMRFCGFLS